MGKTPRRLWAFVLLLGCASQDDVVLASEDGVRIVWRTRQYWRDQGGKNPIPERATAQEQLMIWESYEVELWDYAEHPTPWTREDKLELQVDAAFALYRRNGASWWAVYKGPTGLFHGPKPVAPDAVPQLGDVRAAIFHRQVAPKLRERIVADARAEGEQRVVDLLSHTVDAKEHRGKSHWRDARSQLSEEGRRRVDDALRTAYRERPNTFVIQRASEHLDLAEAQLDEANRAALLELRRAAALGDSWGVHYLAAELLPKLACSDAFAEEREVVDASCP